MIKVYIASPYTIGDPEINVRRQIDAAQELMNAGFAPYAPLLNHFHHLIYPRQDWIEFDLLWLKICDCVLRLEGKSKGADIECDYARKNYNPVFFNIVEIEKYFLDK